MTLTKGLTARDLQSTATAQVSGCAHGKASPALSQILHLVNCLHIQQVIEPPGSRRLDLLQLSPNKSASLLTLFTF